MALREDVTWALEALGLGDQIPSITDSSKLRQRKREALEQEIQNRNLRLLEIARLREQQPHEPEDTIEPHTTFHRRKQLPRVHQLATTTAADAFTTPDIQRMKAPGVTTTGATTHNNNLNTASTSSAAAAGKPVNAALSAQGVHISGATNKNLTTAAGINTTNINSDSRPVVNRHPLQQLLAAQSGKANPPPPPSTTTTTAAGFKDPNEAIPWNDKKANKKRGGVNKLSSQQQRQQSRFALPLAAGAPGSSKETNSTKPRFIPPGQTVEEALITKNDDISVSTSSGKNNHSDEKKVLGRGVEKKVVDNSGGWQGRKRSRLQNQHSAQLEFLKPPPPASEALNAGQQQQPEGGGGGVETKAKAVGKSTVASLLQKPKQQKQQQDDIDGIEDPTTTGAVKHKQRIQKQQQQQQQQQVVQAHNADDNIHDSIEQQQQQQADGLNQRKQIQRNGGNNSTRKKLVGLTVLKQPQPQQEGIEEASEGSPLPHPLLLPDEIARLAGSAAPGAETLAPLQHITGTELLADSDGLLDALFAPYLNTPATTRKQQNTDNGDGGNNNNTSEKNNNGGVVGVDVSGVKDTIDTTTANTNSTGIKTKTRVVQLQQQESQQQQQQQQVVRNMSTSICPESDPIVNSIDDEGFGVPLPRRTVLSCIAPAPNTTAVGTRGGVDKQIDIGVSAVETEQEEDVQQQEQQAAIEFLPSHVLGAKLCFPLPVLHAVTDSSFKYTAILLGSHADHQPTEILLLDFSDSTGTIGMGDCGTIDTSRNRIPVPRAVGSFHVQRTVLDTSSDTYIPSIQSLLPGCMAVAVDVQGCPIVVLSAVLEPVDTPSLGSKCVHILACGGNNKSAGGGGGNGGQQQQQRIMAVDCDEVVIGVALLPGEENKNILLLAGEEGDIHSLKFDPLWTSYALATSLPPCLYNTYPVQQINHILPIHNTTNTTSTTTTSTLSELSSSSSLLIGLTSGSVLGIWEWSSNGGNGSSSGGGSSSRKKRALAAASNSDYNILSVWPVDAEHVITLGLVAPSTTDTGGGGGGDGGDGVNEKAVEEDEEEEMAAEAQLQQQLSIENKKVVGGKKRKQRARLGQIRGKTAKSAKTSPPTTNATTTNKQKQQQQQQPPPPAVVEEVAQQQQQQQQQPKPAVQLFLALLSHKHPQQDTSSPVLALLALKPGSTSSTMCIAEPYALHDTSAVAVAGVYGVAGTARGWVHVWNLLTGETKAAMEVGSGESPVTSIVVYNDSIHDGGGSDGNRVGGVKKRNRVMACSASGDCLLLDLDKL